MFSSTVIPTVNRPTLAHAVHSVLDQTFNEDFEVIVVNDSGSPLPEAEWQHAPHVRIIETNRRERSVARNAGAEVAHGRYLHFLDDDDWLLPEALRTLWLLTERVPDSVWLYGGTQLVDRNGTPLIQLRHGMSGNVFAQVMAGEWIPLQASLIEARAFFAVGGFNPRLAGAEDIDLARRLALRYDVVETDALIACVAMGAEGSSTNNVLQSARSRLAREEVLNQIGAYARMRASADSAYWQGRIARAYLTSLLWNGRRGKLSTAFRRALRGAWAVASAREHLLSLAFWRAIAKPYQSEAFASGLREASFYRI